MTGERIKKPTARMIQRYISIVLAAFVFGALLICASPTVYATQLPEPPISEGGSGPEQTGTEEAIDPGGGQNSGITQPAGSGEEQPPQGEEQPTQGEEQPPQGEEQPSQGEEQPPQGEEQPPQGEEQPPQGEEQPPQGEEQPPQGEEQPTEGEEANTKTQTGSNMTRAAAGQEEEPAAPEPSIPEDQVEVEAYAIPAGSAYIHEISKEYQYTNTADSNAINDALAGALTYLRDLYEEENKNGSQGSTTQRVATIVVQDGTYQGGVSMNPGDGNTLIEQLILDILGLQSASTSSDASNMTIRIVAQDAIVEDDNGNITDIHAGSEGNVKVEGAIDINIQGLNILLAGLYLSTRDLVNIENADSVSYFGTRQDDVVNLNVSGVSDCVAVDTGEGNDTVNADIKKRANVEATVTIDETLIQDFGNLTTLMLPGSGATGQEMAEALKPVVEDLYNALVNGLDASTGSISTVDVDIDLGDGEDSASIKLIDSSDIVASLMGTPDPDTGLNLYQYGFAVDMTAAEMNINGGEGDDRISVSGGRSFTFGQNLMQALIDLVDSRLADKNTLPETKITVTGGQGDDVLTVDTTTAFTTWGGTSITTDGEAGFDRLHLTGKLNDEINADERIYVNADGTELTIEALAQITLLKDLTDDLFSLDFTEQLKVFMNAIDALTDALINKRTIYVGDIQPGYEAQSFTNYIIHTESAKKTLEDGKTEVDYLKVDFSLEDTGLVIPAGGVLLSNILVSDDLVEPIPGRVGLERLIADGLNILIMADIIDVSGDVSAKNLILYAYGEDAALAAIESQVVEDDLNENGDLNVELGLYNADRKLQINIDKNARILAEQAVDLAVQLILNKAFIPGADYIDSLVGKDFNPVTLKFGQAEISIFGTIQAGGYIHARTDVDVTIDATNELIKAVVPVALAVSSGHSRVIVDGDAVLLSGYVSEEAARENAGILLSAASSNDLVAYTHGGSLKFSIALGVVEFETVAQITGNANVNAGGAVKLLASSIVESTSYATGKPSIVWNVAPQSGVFIAGNFIFNETRAIIDGNADVTANQGDLVVDAFADSKASTVSMAIPFNTTPVGDQLTPFNVIPFVEKLIGIRPAGNQTMKGKLLAAVTGSNSLGNLFTDATKSAAPDTTFIQVMGALGTAYVKNDNLAKIETTGTVSTPGTLAVHATATTVSDLRADGSLYRTPSILEGVLGNIFAGGPYATLETVPTHAIGAAIAVHVYVHNNEALIAKGTIQAKNLSVVADSLDADAALVVKAGHTPTEAQTKLGIGGAIAVHVANVYNTAKIQNTAAYEIDGGDVEVIAKGHGTYITVADASGKRSRLNIAVGPLSIPLAPAFSMTANSAGVGAGIAVEVINLDTLAQIEDGVSFGSNNLNSLNVNASFDADFYIEAAAGSTGGVSVAPVVALTVSGVNTKATIGKLDGVVTEMPGVVSVTANTSAIREMIADAKAVGSRAGAGAAVGLSIVDDSAIAELLRSVKADSVTVSADSISRIEQTIYASSQGATPNPVANLVATTEVTIEKFLALFTGNIPAGAAATNSMNPGGADNMTNKNAAALSGLAGRLGGYSGKAGTLSMDRIVSLAEKRPKFQTTEGSVQVAATIAANIQRNKSQATIADGLTIEAQGDVQVTALEDTDAVIYADSTACNGTAGVGVAAAVNYVEYENLAYVGAKDIQANNLIVRADILEAENLRSVQTILAELINYLADVNGIDLLIGPLLEKKGVDSIEELIDQAEFERLFQQHIDQINEGRGENEKLTAAEIRQLRGEQQEIIEKMVIDMLVASLQSNTLETASTLMVDIVDSIVDEFFDLLSDPEFLLSNVLGTGAAKQKFDQFIAEKGMMASISFDMLREAVVTELSIKYGNPSELENLGNRITTSAVSGAGGANVGIAGSLALSLIEGKAQAVIANLVNPGDSTIEASGALELYAQSANKVYTTASSSAANNGLPEKNKKGKADSTGKSVGVGASFAMAKVNAAAEAILGANRIVNAAALGQQAIVHNDIDTASVAGQDPIGRQQSFPDYTTPSLGEPYVPLNQTTSKDIAVDASAALNLIDNTVNALVGSGSELYLGGGNLVETARVIGENAQGEEVYELANLYLLARQRGQTYATASGFATGGTAAVGASVAINLANSDVNAVLNGQGEIAGDVIVDAQTVNEDEAQGFALTYGTSLERYFEKLRTLMSIANFLDNPDTGIVNALVVNKLNQYSSSLLAPLQSNLIKSPLMTMALNALGIQVPIPSANIGNSTASGALAGTGAVAQEVSSSQETSVNIAAAVGVNVTAHKANAEINGNFTANSFDADAQALANYRAYATGATMLANPLPNINASAISMGVAVSVNENAATASLGGNLTARNGGDVRANSTITQNLDDRFAGLLAAQSLAGAIGGSGAGVGLAGAVSVVKANAAGTARILDGANINGGDIVINAVDKSKLAIRAGGLSAGGQTVGVGAAFGMIYDQNAVLARVGDNATVTGKSLDVTAERLPVTAADYEFPFDLTNLFTVSNGSADDSGIGNKGLIHLNITDGSNPDDKKNDNSIEVNLSAEKVLSIIDMLNYLASVNYYIEAISGAISAGPDAKAALTGGFAVLYARSRTSAEIGDNTTVDLTGGTANVEARTDIHTRVIGGSLAATGAAGVGVNAAGFDDTSTVNASIGADSAVTASGDAGVHASAKNDVLAVTVAAALSASAGAPGAAVGGTVDVILTDNTVNASVGDGSTLESTEGSVNIEAEDASDFILVSTSASGSANGPAAGGTLAVIISGGDTTATVGEGATIAAAKDVTIRTANQEDLINVLASASAAASSASAAGTIGVLVTESNALTAVGSGASVTSRNGSVQLLADSDVKQIAVQAALTGSTGAVAAGATVNVGVFEQTAKVHVGDGAQIAADGGSVSMFATGRNQTILVNVAGAAASGTSVSGVIPVVISKSTVETVLGNDVSVRAKDTIAIAADLDAGLYNAAGAISVSTGTAGAGATVSTMVAENTIRSIIGTNAKLIAHGVNDAANSGVKLPNRSTKRRGVIVSANANVQVLMASVSGALSNNSVNGVVNTLVLKNVVKATVDNGAVIEAGFESETSDTESGDDAEAAIESSDESQIFNLAGGVSIASNAGVGATVVSMVYDKDMEASVGTGGTIRATGNVTAAADSNDELYLLALSFAGSGSAAVGVGANALVFENDVAAALGGTVRSGGDVTVSADSETDMINVAAALAGSGTAAVTPVAVVTWFEGTTDAQLLEGASLEADGDVSVSADSREFITSDALGVSVSGTASVSGTVDIIISDQATSAQAQKNVSIDAANIAIAALDDMQVLGVVGTAAASGTAAVGVTAMVGVLHNTVTSGFLGGENPEDNTVSASGSVCVTADAIRDIRSYAASVAAGGTAGVGATIMVNVVGGKLSQDASDSLLTSGDRLTQEQYDALSEKEREAYDSSARGGFNPDGFLNSVYGEEDENPMAGLGEKLAGDGVKQSDIQLGDDEGNFDAETGYVSGDFNDSSKVDADPDEDDLKQDATEMGETELAPGEDFTVDETQNDALSEAGAITAKPSYDAKSAISAVIGSGVQVIAGSDIHVLANDLVNSDMIAATAAGGAYAGVGAGIAVNVLYSDVTAGVDSGAVLNAGGDISVQATSGTVEITEGTDAEEQSQNDMISDLVREESFQTDKDGNYTDNKTGQNKLNITSRTIRSIAVTGAGGIAGVSVSGSVIMLNNNTIAYMNGDVTGADSLSVEASASYPQILAVTGAVSGGVAAVTASTAVVYNEGTAEASIGGTADISGVGSIEVETVADTGVQAVTAAVAGGAAGVNAGVAVAINRMDIRTAIAEAVSISGSGLNAIDVHSDVYTTSDTWLMSIAGGGAAAGLAGAVSIVEPTVYTYIGVSPETAGVAASTGGIDAPNANITVSNDVSSIAKPLVLSVAGGGTAAVTGTVLLSFNNTDAIAGIIRKNIVASTVNVDGNMDAEAEAAFAGATVGGAAVGLSVAYVHLDAANEALLDVTGVSVKADAVGVYAGREADKNTAVAEAVSVSANIGGMAAVSVNAAIADNASKNIARIVGAESSEPNLDVTGQVDVQANGIATAQSDMIGLNIGTLSVGASVSVAVLRSEQKAVVEGGNIKAGGIRAISRLNEGNQNIDTTKAGILTGGGGMISAKANVAVAYGRSASVAGIGADALQVGGGAVEVLSTGNAGTKATVDNQDFAKLSAGIMTGYAYSQGVFDSYLLVGENDSVNAGNVSVQTNGVNTRATVRVTPSAAGVDASLASLDVNMAVASARAVTRARIAGIDGKGGSIHGDSVTVSADSDSRTDAVIETPVFTVSAVSVAANVLRSLVSSTQEASVSDVSVVSRNSMNVESSLNQATGDTARAQLGGTGLENKAGASVDVSMATAKVNFAEADSNARNHAFVKNADVNVESGSLTVKVDGRSDANAFVGETSGSVNVAGIGVNVVYSRARGDFKSGIELQQENTVEALNITQENNYVTNADAISGQPTGGVKVNASLLSVKTNTAYAVTATKAETSILGSGTVIARNALKMSADGTVTAFADVPGTTVSISGISLAVNEATAVVDGAQKVSIEDAAVTAGTTALDGWFNRTLNSNESYAAKAIVGSNGSKTRFNLSIIGGEVSLAEAKIVADVHTGITGATLDVRDLAVSTLAHVRANADIHTGSSVSVYDVTVLETKADAGGTFTSAVDTTDGFVRARNTTVKTDVYVKSQAKTGSAGGLSSSIISVDHNEAEASTGINAQAVFGGHGYIDGNLTVQATGNGKAIANTYAPDLTISLAEVAVNRVTSRFNATQSALLNNTGDLTVAGNVVVNSTMTGDAEANVDGPTGQITALSADVNESRSYSETTVRAGITSANGLGMLSARSVNVDAKAVTSSTSTTRKGVEVSLASYGKMRSEAHTADTVEAFIEKSGVSAGGNVTVDADGQTTANAEASAGVSVGAINIGSSEAKAFVGRENKKQTVKAYVGDNAAIEALGDVAFKAFNSGFGQAEVKKGTTVGLGNITVAKIPTEGWYNTYAGVGSNSSIHAQGDVRIEAEDDTVSKSEAVGSSIGFAVSAADMYGNNTQNVTNKVEIKACEIFADGDVLIQAVSNADMRAYTRSDSSGIFANGDLKAKNVLTRLTQVDILPGAKLESDFGDISVLALAGQNDRIVTEARLDTGGVTGFSNSDTTTTVNSKSKVNISGGTEIVDTFGTVHIEADASMKYLYTYSKSSTRGLGGKSHAWSHTEIDLLAETNIAGTADNLAKIEGRYVEIHSGTRHMDISDNTDASIKALGADVEANTNLTVDMDVNTNVQGAVLRGYDKVNVTATSDPAEKTNVYAYSKVYLGAVGEGYSSVDLFFYADHTYLTIGPDVTIYGADVNLSSEDFAGDVDFKRDKGGALRKYRGGTQRKNISSRTTIDEGTKFYIGDAAAGIVIDIYDRGSGTQIRHVGLEKEYLDHEIGTGTVRIGDIFNRLNGYLTMDTASGKTYTVYDQNYIPYVRIINRTDRDVVLSDITVENSNYIQPTVKTDSKITHKANDYTTPEVSVESRGSGAVDVGGFIANPRGSVSFLWTDPEKHGDLTSSGNGSVMTGISPEDEAILIDVAPVWAHRLTVSGAANVGVDESTRFAAWLFPLGGITEATDPLDADCAEANVDVTATGDVYLNLTPVRLHKIRKENWAPIPSKAAFSPSMRTDTVKALGDVDILFGEGIRLYQMEGSSTVLMPLPGTFQYVTGTMVGLTQDVVIDGDVLAEYVTGYDVLTGIYTYLLPNGTQIFADENGNILRIVEGGIDMTISDYAYDAQSNTITLAEGVTFCLTDGTMHVREGHTFEAFLAAIDGSWIMESSGLTFAFANEEGAVVNSELAFWYHEAGVDYYYLVWGSNPDNVLASAAQRAYIIAHDKGQNAVVAYQLENNGESETSSTIWQIPEYDLSSNQGEVVATEHNGILEAYRLITMKDGDTFRLLTGLYDFHYSGDYIFENGFATVIVQQSENKTYHIAYSEDDQWKLIVTENGNKTEHLLDAVGEFGDGFKVEIEKAARATNADVQKVYSLLGGIYWTMTQSSEIDREVPVCVHNEGNSYTTMVYPYGRYTYTMHYSMLNEVGLTLTEDKLLFTPGSGGSLSIEGEADGIIFKQNDIPYNSHAVNGEGYRITDSLYVTTDGKLIMFRNEEVIFSDNDVNLDGDNASDDTGISVLGNGLAEFAAVYDLTAKTYRSESIQVDADNTITLRKNLLSTGQTQEIMRQSITGFGEGAIATDILGNYYLLENGAWKPIPKANVVITSTADARVTEITASDGTRLLTIRELTTGDTFITLKDGTIVGSDGSVVPSGEATEDPIAQVVGGTDYILGQIEGATVKITMPDTRGSLLDGNDDPNGPQPNITATQGDATFATASEGSIGTEADPLEIVVAGEVKFVDLDAKNVLATDTYLHAQSGDIVIPGGTVVDNSVLHAEAEDGSVINTGDFSVINSGEAELIAGEDIDLNVVTLEDSTLTAEADQTVSIEELDVENSHTELTAGEDVDLGTVTLEDGTLTADAGQTISAEELTVENSDAELTAGEDVDLGTVKMEDGTLTADADQSVSIEELDVESSHTELTADEDVTIGEATLTDSELHVEAGGSVDLGETTAEESEIGIISEEDVKLDKLAAEDSVLNVDAKEDIQLDIIEAKESDVTLETENGDILPLDEGSYIRFIDSDDASDESLTLSTENGDIASEDTHLIIDTDETLFIPNVDDYYIDFVELLGDENYTGKRPVENIYSGIDEFGEYREGDYISAAGPDETVYVALKTQLGEDIAAVLTDRMDRAEWSAMIDEAVMLALIKAESITAEQMEQLLGQTGNPLVLEDIQALLEQGDELTQGETLSGYEKLAQALLNELDSKNADDEAVFSDDLLETWLAEGITLSQVNIDTLADALEDTMTPEEVEQLIQDAYAKADYESQKSTMPEDPEPRGIEIQVGQATGGAYVENEGDITIIQRSGTLTAGAVISDRGDVTLTSETGGIEGTADESVNVLGKEINLNARLGVGANTPVRVEQRDNRLTLVGNVIKPYEDGAGGYADVNVDALDEDGVPTTEAESENRPEALFALETLVRFDWLRVEYPEDAMQLNVTAGGDVNIQEVTGDMGVGVVSSENGDITLTSDGDVVDNRDEGETRENIITDADDADAAINAENGQVGSNEKPIETDVGGTITAITEGDVNITDTDTLDLIVQIEDGQVNASAEEDVNISNLSGDLTVGPIQAGGDADITSEGSILAGDRLGEEAQVEAENISLTAKDGHIGTPEEAFLVDTDAEQGGKLSAEGDYLNIRELDGDLILEDIDSTTDAEISAPGSILDGNDSTVTEAVQAQKDANEAQAEADEAEAKAQVQEEEAAQAGEVLKEAEEALEEAIANTEAGIQTQLDKAEEELQNLTPGTDAYEEKLQQIEELKEQLEEAKRDSEDRDEALQEAQQQYQEALDEYNAQQKEADEARSEADEAAEEAKRLQDLADAAKDAAAAEDPTVTTGGDLTLEAGDAIGTEDTGLTVDVDGTVHADAEEEVHLDGHGDLNLSDITTEEEIRINTVDGDINGGVLDSEKVDVNALDGDIGTREDPLTTNADQIDAQGDNVYIHNLKDTTIGNITAEDELVLDSDGDVTGTGEGPHVSADDATIHADGDIGSEDKPLDTNVDAFHGDAEDIYLDNHSPDMEISDVTADSLDVETDGNVTGDDNKLHDITIDADGFVGRPDDPFEFWADGIVSIQGNLGSWWRNLYQRSSGHIQGRLTALLVLKFQVNVAGRSMTLYALVGVTPDGNLRFLGFFLCRNEADEVFFRSMFAYLKDGLNIHVIDAVIHHGDQALEIPAQQIFDTAKFVDLAEYPEGEWKQLLGQLTGNPDALSGQLNAFQARIEAQLKAPFETEQEMYAALQGLGNPFTQSYVTQLGFAG